MLLLFVIIKMKQTFRTLLEYFALRTTFSQEVWSEKSSEKSGS